MTALIIRSGEYQNFQIAEMPETVLTPKKSWVFEEIREKLVRTAIICEKNYKEKILKSPFFVREISDSLIAIKLSEVQGC